MYASKLADVKLFSEESDSKHTPVARTKSLFFIEGNLEQVQAIVLENKEEEWKSNTTEEARKRRGTIRDITRVNALGLPLRPVSGAKAQ